MQGNDTNKQNKKSQLLKTIGEIVKKHRLKSNKGILLHSYEFDIPSSSLSLIERGARDVQITTLWKIANSLGMTFGEFINEIEEHLPPNFTMIEDK